MIRAEDLMQAALARGFGLFSGVPCSYLTQFINQVTRDGRIHYVPAANEGDAVAIAAGAQLGGVRAVAMMQNSGLGNAVSPLTSLNHVFGLPILLIVTLRGDPGGAGDEPQHALMGQITTQILDTMRIPWRWMPTATGELAGCLDAAVAWMDAEQRPFALVVRKRTIGGEGPAAAAHWPAPVPATAQPAPAQAGVRRRDMLAAVQAAAPADAVLLATTGFTGRELYALDDRANQFYMVGSMGCLSSFALGLALVQPDRPIIAIDGDGALLMRMGALAVIGAMRPPNLLHLLLDNGQHESTGGQANVSPAVDYPALAAACGYPSIRRCATPQALREVVREWRGGLGFVHLPVLPGVPQALPRPTVTPPQVRQRLRGFLDST